MCFNKYVSTDKFLATDLPPSDLYVGPHCQGQAFLPSNKQ
jgi:hypothetical protein